MEGKRGRHAAMRALSGLLLALSVGAVVSASEPQRLGVIVPSHRGDLPRTVSALGRWPTACSPVTQRNVDLVLYYAEGENDAEAAAALEAISSTAGRCFANTKIVYANLGEEEDVYPKGPSVQFYKMFLDESVKSELADYDALAIIEWDVLVASDRSFAELYRAAFNNAEDFWVKGSNLEGTNFHAVAESPEMWHVMGHINGNAIYNNKDPSFAEFVEYTLARWEYKYPYDVALWATISDFPYSWPLWQRYSSKFVTTNLISNVGYEHVDSQSVSDAVAGETLFIHGSSVDDGNRAVVDAAVAAGGSGVPSHAGPLCEAACGSTSDPAVLSLLPAGTSTICDPTCASSLESSSRFGGYLCGAGNSATFGALCRMCYTDITAARQAERELPAGLHVIMCDTGRPPAAHECSDECSLKKDTVCDETCGTGVHGDYNCNWRGLGSTCRFCFDDEEAAFGADEVAKRHGGRVIMCDTHEPPVSTEAISDPRAPALTASRQLTYFGGKKYRKYHSKKDMKDSEDKVPKWKLQKKWKQKKKWQGNPDKNKEPKWKRTKKWQGRPDKNKEPKWKRTQKWKRNRCLPGCERVKQHKKKGRVCDTTCKKGIPYGKRGCNAKKGKFGRLCRVCYNDVELARKKDSPKKRAIMCDTKEPVTTYGHRQLSNREFNVKQATEDREVEIETRLESFLRHSAAEAFTDNVKRGEICVFVEGRADSVQQTDVTVQSILEFAPGVTVAVAAQRDSFDVYRSMVGMYPSVRVSSTPNAHLASLFADQHCGEGTKLILYMQTGSVLSRTFTSKDTHTPRGELLVVYGDAHKSYADALIARETAAVLGFDAPSFTYGTDLMLPFGINAELRNVLSTGEEETVAAARLSQDVTSVPQLLAALAYSHDTEGVHFVDPQSWVTDNLFKTKSIWDIPLMKPRFSCAIPSSFDSHIMMNGDDSARADLLRKNLIFFRMGGPCESGLVNVDLE